MKRKIFGKLLMGAFLIASVSAFVSCKDYDDDISKVNADVTALKTSLDSQIKTLTDALNQAKSEAATAHATFATKVELANAQSALEDADEANATAIKANVDAINALKEAVAKAADAAQMEQAIADLKALAEAQINEEELTAALAILSARIDAINEDLNTLKTDVPALKAWKETVDASVLAVTADLATQKAAIEALQAAINGKADAATVEAIVAQLAAKADASAVEAVVNALGGKADASAVETALAGKADASAIATLTEAIQKLSAEKLDKGSLTGLANEEAVKTYIADQLKAYAKAGVVDASTTAAIAKALEGYKNADELTKILGSYATIEKVTETLKAYYTMNDIDEQAKKSKEYIDNQITTVRNEAISEAKVSEIANNASNAVSQALGSQINVLNVLVTKRLASIVFDPQFYWGGIESMEAPRLTYWPLKYTKAYNASKPYNKVDGSGDLITTGYVDQRDANYLYLPIEADYFMNPSTASIEDITEVTAVSADKEAYTRAAACNPIVKSYSAKNGILSAKIAVDWNRIANVQELTFNSTSVNGWLYNGNYYVYGGAENAVNSTVNTQAGVVSILALQTKIKGEKNDTIITSDFAAIAPSTIANLEIVDNCPSANFFDNCDIPNVRNMFHVYKTEFDAIDNAYTHELIWNDAEGIDLNKIVEVHADRILGVSGSSTGEIKLEDLKERYGLELKYELIDWTSGGNYTVESSKHATLNGSILKANGINGQQTKASIGREPLVKIELIDTNNKNALVQIGYIKFQIVGEKAPDVTIKTYEATTYYLCSGFPFYLKWHDVEGDILANNEIVKDGVSQTTFERVYGIARGNDGSYYADIDWNGNIQGTTYILVDGKWVPYSAVSGYNNSVIRYIIGYNANYVYDSNQQQTNVFGFDMDQQQLQYLLAKRSGDRNKPYLKANGDKTATWTEAALNNSSTITIAVRLVDKNKSGYPDIYVPFKLNVSMLYLTLNKIPEYWYGTNSIAANSGFDEIHVNVDVLGEPSASIKHFAGDLFSTIYKNDIALAAKPAQDAIVGQSHGFIAADGHAINDLTRTRINNDKLNVNLYFIAGTVKDPVTNSFGKIVNSTSGTQYFVYPKNSKTLAAYRWDSRNNRTTGGSTDIVTIENSAITGLTSIQSVFTLNNDPENTVLEDILNYASHKDLANSLTATVGMTVTEGACEVPVILTNPTFDVKFLRPLNPKGAAEKVFTDAIDNGNKLDIVDLIKLSDWRDQWDADYTKTNNYWKYYVVKSIVPDLANITTTMGGGTLGSTKLKDVSNQVQVTYVATGATHKVKAGAPTVDFGYLQYTNNNNTVTDFKIRVPLKVGYYWGQNAGQINTYVDIAVKNTTNN